MIENGNEISALHENLDSKGTIDRLKIDESFDDLNSLNKKIISYNPDLSSEENNNIFTKAKEIEAKINLVENIYKGTILERHTDVLFIDSLKGVDPGSKEYIKIENINKTNGYCFLGLDVESKTDKVIIAAINQLGGKYFLAGKDLNSYSKDVILAIFGSINKEGGHGPLIYLDGEIEFFSKLNDNFYKSHPEFVNDFITKYPDKVGLLPFNYIPKDMLNDYICLDKLRKGLNISQIPSKFYTKEVLSESIKTNWHTLKYIKEDSPILNNKKDLKEVILYSLGNNSYSYRYINTPYRSKNEVLTNIFPDLYKDSNIINMVIEGDGSILSQLPDKYKKNNEICIRGVNNSIEALPFIDSTLFDDNNFCNKIIDSYIGDFESFYNIINSRKDININIKEQLYSTFVSKYLGKVSIESMLDIYSGNIKISNEKYIFPIIEKSLSNYGYDSLDDIFSYIDKNKIDNNKIKNILSNIDIDSVYDYLYKKESKYYNFVIDNYFNDLNKNKEYIENEKEKLKNGIFYSIENIKSILDLDNNLGHFDIKKEFTDIKNILLDLLDNGNEDVYIYLLTNEDWNEFGIDIDRVEITKKAIKMDSNNDNYTFDTLLGLPDLDINIRKDIYNVLLKELEIGNLNNVYLLLDNHNLRGLGIDIDKEKIKLLLEKKVKNGENKYIDILLNDLYWDNSGVDINKNKIRDDLFLKIKSGDYSVIDKLSTNAFWNTNEIKENLSFVKNVLLEHVHKNISYVDNLTKILPELLDDSFFNNILSKGEKTLLKGTLWRVFMTLSRNKEKFRLLSRFIGDFKNIDEKLHYSDFQKNIIKRYLEEYIQNGLIDFKIEGTISYLFHANNESDKDQNTEKNYKEKDQNYKEKDQNYKEKDLIFKNSENFRLNALNVLGKALKGSKNKGDYINFINEKIDINKDKGERLKIFQEILRNDGDINNLNTSGKRKTAIVDIVDYTEEYLNRESTTSVSSVIEGKSNPKKTIGDSVKDKIAEIKSTKARTLLSRYFTSEGGLNIKGTVDLGSGNGTVTASSDDKFTYVNSLGYKFEFDKNLEGEDGKKFFDIIDKVMFLDKTGVTAMGGEFRKMIDFVSSQSSYLEDLGYNVSKLSVVDKDNFISDGSEMGQLLTFFKDIGLLENDSEDYGKQVAIDGEFFLANARKKGILNEGNHFVVSEFKELLKEKAKT